MTAADLQETIRSAAKPVSLVILVLCVAACAVIETARSGSTPVWYAIGVGGTLVDWLVERHMTKKTRAKAGMETPQRVTEGA